MRRLLLRAGLCALVLALVPAAATADDPPPPDPDDDVVTLAEGVQPARGTVSRLSGPTRIETAAQISRSTFEPGVPVAFIATGANFPDAMTGGPLAASIGSPVLLVIGDVVPPATASELRRLRPDRIVVLGGTEVVSAEVAEELVPFVDSVASVERLSGDNRFETAAEIARAAFTRPVPVALIAGGLDFPDALSGAAAGAQLGGPVLLTAPDALPEPTRQALEDLAPQRIIVLGGTNAVSSGVADELTFFTDGEVDRWAGEDRFETSKEIARQAFTAEETSAAYMATGANFPDALTGAAAAGTRSGPLLLTARYEVPDGLTGQLERLAPGGLDVIILGGNAVVDDRIADQLGAYANPTLSRLVGVVTDATTDEPVAEARVRLRRGEAIEEDLTAGQRGRVTIDGLVWGELDLLVSRLGYAAVTTTIEVEPGADDEVAIALDRVASVTGGVVREGTDVQLVGAEVVARRVVEGDPVGEPVTVTTDDDGAFLVSVAGGLEAGRYHVQATLDGFVAGSALVDVADGSWTEDVTIELVALGG